MGKGLQGARRLARRHFRSILAACGATLVVSIGLLSVLSWMESRTRRAVDIDLRFDLDQMEDQLIQELEHQRLPLVLLRDLLATSPDLNLHQRRALGKSAVERTPHLLGVGFFSAGTELTPWVLPPDENARDLDAIERRAREVRGSEAPSWPAPTRFTVDVPSGAAYLVQVEPIAEGQTALAGILDLQTLLRDFFEIRHPSPHPSQLREGSIIRYRSPHWSGSSVPEPEHRRAVRHEELDWTLEMLPGATSTARAVGGLELMLGGLGILAGIALIALVWILSLRTLLLQQLVRRRTAALRRTTERLRVHATTDALTGLMNRRVFLERWEAEMERARRYDHPLACLMIDVNDFKPVNDRCGHLAGDEVLRLVARELRKHLRATDLVARFGGDEFVLALPETSLEEAEAVAGKIRELEIHGEWDEACGPIRLSVGLGCTDGSESPEDPLRRADGDLYAWKSEVGAGR